MLKVYINNFPVFVKKGTTVLHACSFANVDIPKFCFHEALITAGNCRICLVEIERIPKPVASCAIPVADNIKIFTATPLVKKSRELVLEFLLINHPLDCPICDQGGECDLQNQSLSYGSDFSRFFFKKRNVFNFKANIVIKTVINRCIHCTRCVRFLKNYAGCKELSMFGRGKKSEIGLFTKSITIKNFLSGNIIDLCPVGFLTFKKYL